MGDLSVQVQGGKAEPGYLQSSLLPVKLLLLQQPCGLSLGLSRAHQQGLTYFTEGPQLVISSILAVAASQALTS